MALAISSSSIPTDDFLILPIKIPPLSSFPTPTVHEIRLRRNTPTVPTPTDSRCLFLKNVPADSTEGHFRAVFASLVGPGRFESIFFEDDPKWSLTVDPAQTARLAVLTHKRKRDEQLQKEDEEAAERLAELEAARLPEIWSRRVKRSGSSAIALLADEKSVQTVLKAVARLQKSKKYPTWGDKVPDTVPQLGSRWVAHHLRESRPFSTEPTRNAVHALFTLFNRREKEGAELAKRLANEPDEDGFVTVTRGATRSAPASAFEAEEARRRMLKKLAKRRSETSEFYRFQVRERRKQAQVDLAGQFEEDRKRVKLMKEKRGRTVPET